MTDKTTNTIKPWTWIVTMPNGKTTQIHAWRNQYRGFVAHQENGKWKIQRLAKHQSPEIMVKVLIENEPTCNAQVVPFTVLENR